jgi:hypothetical protein
MTVVSGASGSHGEGGGTVSGEKSQETGIDSQIKFSGKKFLNSTTYSDK